jgi:hypothetical protein
LLPYLPPEQPSTLPASEDVTAVTGYSSSTPLFFGRPARPWTRSSASSARCWKNCGPRRHPLFGAPRQSSKVRTEERNQPRGTPLRWLGLAQKEQTLGQMNPGRGAKRPRSIRPYAMQSGKSRILLRAVLPTCPGRQWLGLFRPQHGPDPVPWGLLATTQHSLCVQNSASWNLAMGPSIQRWDPWLVVEQATLLRRGSLHERIFSQLNKRPGLGA